MAAILDDKEENILREPSTTEEADEFLWFISSKLGGPPGPVAKELQESSRDLQRVFIRNQREIRKTKENLINMQVTAS